MSLTRAAIDEADQVVATVLEFIDKNVEQRRKEAAWWYVYRSRRAAYATSKVARRVWLFWARRSKAMMEANQAIAAQVCGKLASMPGGRVV